MSRIPLDRLTMFVAALLLVGRTIGAAAQETIPKELALALIRGGAEGADLMVGQLPPDLAAQLTLPRDARVLGSFVSATYADVAIDLPLSPDSARAEIRRSLAAKGWTVREAFRPQMGGLVMGPPRSEVSSTYCRPGRTDAINVNAVHRGLGSRVHVTMNQSSAVCDDNARRLANQQEMAYRSPFADVPPLYAPEDAERSMFTCRTSGGGAGGSATQVQPVHTGLSPRELVGHYARQLDSAGWRAASADSVFAQGQWSKPSTAEAERVVITVTRIAGRPGCYDVSLTAARERR